MRVMLVKVRYREKQCNYRQGSEWCAAICVVFNIMTNNKSIHEL